LQQDSISSIIAFRIQAEIIYTNLLMKILSHPGHGNHKILNKGNWTSLCTVVLNTANYHREIITLLSYNTAYEALKRDPTTIRRNSQIQDLEKNKVIEHSFYHRLYPMEATLCIYGLPKIHKEGVLLRLNFSSINLVTFNITKQLASILAPLVGSSPHHIQNSTDFAKKIQRLKLFPSEIIVSLDVTSLLTCIPISAAVQTVRKWLLQDDSPNDRTSFTPDLCPFASPPPISNTMTVSTDRSTAVLFSIVVHCG